MSGEDVRRPGDDQKDDGTTKPKPLASEELRACWCFQCLNAPELLLNNPVLMQMILCPACGNKRCPRATDHRFACTGSNAADQDGSRYGTSWDALHERVAELQQEAGIRDNDDRNRRSEAAKLPDEVTPMEEGPGLFGCGHCGVTNRALTPATPDNVPCVRCRWPQTNHPITERREGEMLHVMHHIVCPVHEGWTAPADEPRAVSSEAAQAECDVCVGMQYEFFALAEAFYPFHEAWTCDPDGDATRTLMARLEHITRCCQNFPSRESLEASYRPSGSGVGPARDGNAADDQPSDPPLTSAAPARAPGDAGTIPRTAEAIPDAAMWQAIETAFLSAVHGERPCPFCLARTGNVWPYCVHFAPCILHDWSEKLNDRLDAERDRESPTADAMPPERTDALSPQSIRSFGGCGEPDPEDGAGCTHSAGHIGPHWHEDVKPKIREAMDRRERASADRGVETGVAQLDSNAGGDVRTVGTGNVSSSSADESARAGSSVSVEQRTSSPLDAGSSPAPSLHSTNPASPNARKAGGCGCVCSDCLRARNATHRVCSFGCALKTRATNYGPDDRAVLHELTKDLPRREMTDHERAVFAASPSSGLAPDLLELSNIVTSGDVPRDVRRRVMRLIDEVVAARSSEPIPTELSMAIRLARFEAFTEAAEIARAEFATHHVTTGSGAMARKIEAAIEELRSAAKPRRGSPVSSDPKGGGT